MVNEAIEQVATSGAKQNFFGFFSIILRFLFWSWIIIIFFLSSIIKGIEAKDMTITLYDLGNRFFLVSNELNNKSLEIITNGFIYGGFFKTILFLSEFASAFIVIYLWLKLISFIYGRMPWSDPHQSGKNYSVALIIFIFIQIFASLVNAGVTGTMTSYMGKDNSVFYFVAMPFISIINFFKAFYIILKPIVYFFQSKFTK